MGKHGGLTKTIVTRLWGIAKSKALKPFRDINYNEDEARKKWAELRKQYKGLQIPNKSVYHEIYNIGKELYDTWDNNEQASDDIQNDMPSPKPGPSGVEPPSKKRKENPQLTSRITEDVIESTNDEGTYMLPQEDVMDTGAVSSEEITSTGGSECVEGAPMASATGNNVLYQGFGGTTIGSNPKFITVKKTFRRTFTSVINFTKQRKAEMELLTNTTDDGWTTAITDPCIAKFTVNHGGHIIPY